MELSTDALDANGFFDARYTCDIDNSSPEIRWTDPPPNCVELALIAEDLDGPQGRLALWIIYHIPPSVRHLPPGIPAQDTLPNGIQQGINGFKKLGYSGPCPSFGDPPHAYVFRLYALNKTLELSSRARRETIIEAMEGHILETAELYGRYERAIKQAG